MKTIFFWLKLSRPGLWFATIWLYLLPTSQVDHIWQTIPFWIGLVYITFPLNFLVYGWNDIVDYEADQVNPRKDNFWFGAKGKKEQLASLWKALVGVQVICLPVLFYYMGLPMLWLMLAFIFVNGLYNLPKHGLRSTPPLELFCQVGYLLIAPFSTYINDLANLPSITYLYLFLFACQSHLMGEVMDIEADRLAHKKTTATVIGMKWTKLLIITIVAIEVGLLIFIFEDLIFAGILGMGLVWLLLDLLLIFKTNRYTLFQMKLFAVLSNIVAIISMAYVWYSGCLI